MTTGVAKFRNVVGALALLALTVVSQSGLAQQAKSVDPTASAVTEEQLLQQFKTIQGRGSIPDTKSYTIEQPAGRDWRHFHEVTLRVDRRGRDPRHLSPCSSSFTCARGMVRIESGRSGRTIVRFNAAERFVHWMTATCVRHSRLVRAQHHLRQTAAAAADEPRGLHRLVGMGEVRAQLSELSVHPRRHPDLPDVDRRQSSPTASTSNG